MKHLEEMGKVQLKHLYCTTGRSAHDEEMR